MAPTNAIAGPEVHDRGIMQLAPELTIDGPQQDGYSLNKKIREFITGWNKRKHPFVWTKTPEQVLAKAKPKPTSETRH